jgi:hypothetical protein
MFYIWLSIFTLWELLTCAVRTLGLGIHGFFKKLLFLSIFYELQILIEKLLFYSSTAYYNKKGQEWKKRGFLKDCK